jgi:hypothetical protein
MNWYPVNYKKPGFEVGEWKPGQFYVKWLNSPDITQQDIDFVLNMLANNPSMLKQTLDGTSVKDNSSFVGTPLEDIRYRNMHYQSANQVIDTNIYPIK